MSLLFFSLVQKNCTEDLDGCRFPKDSLDFEPLMTSLALVVFSPLQSSQLWLKRTENGDSMVNRVYVDLNPEGSKKGLQPKSVQMLRS